MCFKRETNACTYVVCNMPRMEVNAKIKMELKEYGMKVGMQLCNTRTINVFITCCVVHCVKKCHDNI